METAQNSSQISMHAGDAGNVESCNDDDYYLLLTLSTKDPLYEKKKKLLCARGFSPEVRVLLSPSESPNATLKVLVEAARIVHLDEGELYFAGVDACQPVDFYSPRNELESLSSILSLIDISLKGSKDKEVDILKVLRDATIDKIREFGDQNSGKQLIEKCTCHAEDLLLQWGKDHGLKTNLQIAHVEGAGRGVMALKDLEVGDAALDIPESIIISEELVYKSEMFDILKEIDGISPETMLLLWSMKERYNSLSKYKIFFQTLPERFNTGLSFGIDALSALESTLLFEEIMQAKEHLHMQYDVLCPDLCGNHPDIFQPDLYTWDQFLWACELWYSNSMKVISSDGKLKTCLLHPHILHYGRVESTTKSLKFSLSRPCKEGDQCYLSYGNLSSSHLITFYGFLPKGENIYDIIPLDIDAPQADKVSDCLESDWTTHMVRGTWLPSNHELFYYGLPPPLLDYLRATLNDSKLATETYINTENEMAVLETLYSIFNPMLEELGAQENTQRENLGWDVKLAVEFKDLQRRTISSVMASCSAGIGMLQCLELKETMKSAKTNLETGERK